MAALKLHYSIVSPPARAVLLVARALDLKLDLKPVNLMRGEQLTPEYAKINPTATVPTLDDNGFILYDSHAINGYLVSKYGKTDALYPKDVQARAVVDQRLHLDSGLLFPRLREIVFPLFRREVNTISDPKIAAAREAYRFVENVLGDNHWVAGNTMTIADYSCVVTIAGLSLLVPGVEDCPKVTAWVDRCRQAMPGYKEINDDSLAKYKTQILSLIKSKI